MSGEPWSILHAGAGRACTGAGPEPRRVRAHVAPHAGTARCVPPVMSNRRVDVRRGMTVGLGFSIFFTILSTAQAPPQDRVAAFALTATA